MRKKYKKIGSYKRRVKKSGGPRKEVHAKPEKTYRRIVITCISFFLGVIGIVLTYHYGRTAVIKNREIEKAYELTEKLDIENREYSLDRLRDETEVLRLYRRGLEAEESFNFEKTLDCYNAGLRKTKDISKRIPLYLARGRAYHVIGDYKNSRDSYSLAFMLARKIEDEEGKMWALNGLGVTEWGVGNIDRAISNHEKSLKIAKIIKNDAGIFANTANLGLAYHRKGDFLEAISYFTRAKELAGTSDNEKLVASMLVNIGTCYSDAGDLTRADLFYEEAACKFHALGDRIKEGGARLSSGINLELIGADESALIKFENARKLFHSEGVFWAEADAVSGIADIYCKRKEYAEALTLYFEALELDMKASTRGDENRDLANIGYCYYLSGNPNKALPYLTKAYRGFTEIGKYDAASSVRSLIDLAEKDINK